MPAKKTKPVGASKRKIFLVEDHPITREGFAQLLNFNADLIVCGQAGSSRKAMDGIAASKPDVVVVDISLGDGSGIELIKSIKARFGKLPMLVLSTHDENIYAERALHAGALGYVMKQSPTADVLKAVREVLAGQIYVSDTMRGRILQKMVSPRSDGAAKGEGLTDRELEVLELIGEGRTTKQIAGQLTLSVSTVETHRAHLKEKLKLNTATELVRYAVEWVNRTNR